MTVQRKEDGTRVITEDDRLQLVGLLYLVRHHNERLLELEKVIADLLDEKPDKVCKDYYGHVSDAVFSSIEGYTAQKLLDLLEIEIVDEQG